MFDAFDESRLLALIEDELSPAEAETLRRELAARPDVMATLEQMRADRALLRSLPEPEVPAHVLASLEPVLARPLLMDDTAPGSYRRKFKRAQRRRRLLRTALAAGFLLVVSGGLVAAIVMLGGDGRSKPTLLVADEPASSADLDGVPAGARDDARSNDGVSVHHQVPAPGLFAHDETASPTAEPRRRTAGPVLSGEPVALPVALVLLTEDANACELALTDLTRRDQSRLALVQNLTFDEARQIERLFLARGPSARGARGGDDEEPLFADAGDHRGRRLADEKTRRYWQRVERRLLRMLEVPADHAAAVPLSRQLAGRSELAASYASQLQFSDRGATHTVTLPVAELNGFLAEAHRLPAATSSLTLLPDGASKAVVPSNWADSRPTVRQRLAEIEAAHPDALVLLPVVVRAR